MQRRRQTVKNKRKLGPVQIINIGLTTFIISVLTPALLRLPRQGSESIPCPKGSSLSTLGSSSHPQPLWLRAPPQGNSRSLCRGKTKSQTPNTERELNLKSCVVSTWLGNFFNVSSTATVLLLPWHHQGTACWHYLMEHFLFSPAWQLHRCGR